MSEITIALGKKIRPLRQSRGWTQEMLAEYADLHVSYVVLLEKGSSRATSSPEKPSNPRASLKEAQVA